MKYDLATMAKRARNTRRRSITFRPITAPGVLASDLYASVYKPVIRAWEGVIPALLAEYERSLSAMTTDSPADIGNILESHEGDLFRLILTLKLRVQEWGMRLERWERGKWSSAVLSATGVDVSTLIGVGDVRDTIEATVQRNVSLVKSVSEQTRQRIGDSVFRGLNRRAPAREVAKEISEAVGMSRRRALNIASHQTSNLTERLNDERRNQAGCPAWEWLHSAKAHPRIEHLERNGERYSDDPADDAPPPSDRPGELPGCGCTSRAILSLDSEF